MANNKRKKSGTTTSAFGAPGRIAHDSSKFYKSKLYSHFDFHKDISYEENYFDDTKRNLLYCSSSENMKEIPDNSIHLVITSPLINVLKSQNDLTLDEYQDILKRVFKESHRVLVSGGRACIIVINSFRKPYIPLHRYIIKDMHEIGFLMRGEIIWNKASSASPSTAWGTWKSASNPVLRDIHEYILIFSKDTFTRRKNDKENTITKEEFLEYTKSVWTFPAVSARKIGHPAPFPIELPRRLIELYSFKGDIILDPFCGSGTTCIAALKTNRHYIGYDTSQEYVDLANRRINHFLNQPSLFDEQ